MEYRKDSEADRLTVTNTAFMQSKWSTELRHQSERSLWQNVVAGILALVVATGIGRFAYTPVLPAMLERFLRVRSYAPDSRMRINTREDRCQSVLSSLRP